MPTKFSKRKKKKKSDFSGFDYDDSDDEDKREEPMWQTREQRRRQEDALKTPYNQYTDPFILRGIAEAAAQDAAMAKAAADKATAEKAKAAEEDQCIKSDAYESIANLSEIGDKIQMEEEETEEGGGDGVVNLDDRLKEGKEIEEGEGDGVVNLDDRLKRGEGVEGKEITVDQININVRRVVRRSPSIPNDTYVPMDIVDRLPQEEEAAMSKQFISDIDDDDPTSLPPRILLNVAKHFFNAPHIMSIPDPCNADNADNADNDNNADNELDDNEKIVEIGTPRRVSIKVRAEIDAIRLRISKLRAEEIIPLYDAVSKDSLPEILANTLACLQYSKTNRQKVQVVMAHWLPFLSMEERRRFLASAAKFTAFLDMPEWLAMLQYHRFDLLMLVHPRATTDLYATSSENCRGMGREFCVKEKVGWIMKQRI